MRGIVKTAVFIGLIAGFFWFSEASFRDHSTRAALRADAKIILMFISGAALMLWGDKRIGILDPISLRGLFVVLGVLLMILSIVLASALKKIHEPNKKAAGSNAGIASAVPGHNLYDWGVPPFTPKTGIPNQEMH